MPIATGHHHRHRHPVPTEHGQHPPVALGQGLALQGAWVVIFGALAWSRFTTADVSS